MTKTFEQRAHHVTCIDVNVGLSLNTGGQKTDSVLVVLEDSIFYGETEADDCSASAGCICRNKFALMATQHLIGSKDLMVTSRSSLPIWKAKSDHNWGGRVELNRNKFTGFSAPTKCGKRQAIFERNHYAADKIPPHYFFESIFDNVSDIGLAFLDKPNPDWANDTDCGDFPCTGPNNLIFSFASTTYSGVKPSVALPDFTMVPNDVSVGGTYPTCVNLSAAQAYICQIENVGLLQFESLDADTMDRSVQPVFVLNSATGYNNTLNSFMDHLWNGFYTSQKRLSRFNAALLTGQDYVVEFTGTNPNKMRFNLETRAGGVKIKIPYSFAQAIGVSANGVRIAPNNFDDAIGQPGLITKTKGCGENRFVGVFNYLEFWLEPGCEIRLEPIDSIIAKVRMDWTFAEFFSDGGTTTFIDRLAASLGVPSYKIKVVAIYSGSVIVDF